MSTAAAVAAEAPPHKREDYADQIREKVTNSYNNGDIDGDDLDALVAALDHDAHDAHVTYVAPESGPHYYTIDAKRELHEEVLNMLNYVGDRELVERDGRRYWKIPV